MSLEDFYFIAEIIAAFAMIASLLFVGIQVRQNTAATQISNSQASLHAWTNLTSSMANDEGLSQIYATRRTLAGSPVDSDELRMGMWVTAHVKATEWNYLQWLEGNLSDDLWFGYRGALAYQWKITPDFMRHWETAGQELYSDPFRTFVEAEIMGSGEAG